MGAGQNWLTNKGADLISGVKKGGNANKQRTGGMQRFITEMQSKNGFYRGAFFEVYFNNIGTTNTQYAMNLICHKAALPGFRLETKDNFIYALPYETPVGVAFDPVWLTFYIDNQFTANNAIWNGTFNNTDSRAGRINQNSWSPKYRMNGALMNIQITAFTIDDPAAQDRNTKSGESIQTWDGLNVVAQYTLHNAFFKAMQQTPVDWAENNVVSSVTAEVSYEWFSVKYPSATDVITPPSVAAAVDGKTNFDTVMAKFPFLGPAYDAAKRTVANNPAVMNNPILNGGGQFLP